MREEKGRKGNSFFFINSEADDGLALGHKVCQGRFRDGVHRIVIWAIFGDHFL